MRRRRTWIAGSVVVGGAALGAGLLVSHGSAGPAPAPGVSAGVSSLQRLPPATDVPSAVARFVRLAASARGTDPEQALRAVRRLRSNLGRTSSAVYAFESAHGAPCFVLVGHAGACAKTASDGTPGLQWTIGGGYGDVPSNLVGIVSDDVTGVTLLIDGSAVPVSLKNNVVFGEFSSAAKRAKIVVHRADRIQNSVEIELDG